KDSLEGQVAPPQYPHTPPAIRSKRIQQMLERRRDWPFISPDDLSKPPTLESLLGVPEYDKDGMEKKKLSGIEQFYEDLERKSASRSNDTRLRDDRRLGYQDPLDLRQDSNSDDDSWARRDKKEAESGLRKLLNSNRIAPGLMPEAGRNSAPDLFGQLAPAPAA